MKKVKVYSRLIHAPWTEGEEVSSRCWIYELPEYVYKEIVAQTLISAGKEAEHALCGGGGMREDFLISMVQKGRDLDREWYDK